MNKYLIAALAVAVLSLGWAADYYHDKAVEWRTTAQSAQEVTRRQAATITDMNQRQQQLAALDQSHTEALNAAESQNDNLRRQLAAGTRRMYVKGKCPVSGTGKSSGPGGVGNAATVELFAGAGQNVLDIRAGIISDQQKLKYLQDYIRQQCLK